MKYIPPRHDNNCYTCYFDGACEPVNPRGNMGIGAVIYRNFTNLGHISKYIPADYSNSNNLAEYMALEWIINTLLNKKFTDLQIRIYGDSNLVVQQMNGNWRIKQGRYIEVAKRCLEKIHTLPKGVWRINWIPRHLNDVADLYSKSELLKNNVEFRIQPE